VHKPVGTMAARYCILPLHSDKPWFNSSVCACLCRCMCLWSLSSSNADMPVRKMSLRGDNNVSVRMPLLNHALHEGAVKIQSVVRGRREKRRFDHKKRETIQAQAIVRRYLATLAVRAERRRRRVGDAIGSVAAVAKLSLADWLASNGLARHGKQGRDIQALLQSRGNITAVEQLAKLSEVEALVLASKVFGKSRTGTLSFAPVSLGCRRLRIVQ